MTLVDVIATAIEIGLVLVAMSVITLIALTMALAFKRVIRALRR